jgi:hypothetical protein
MIAVAAALAGPAKARDQNREYMATPHGWLPGMSTEGNTRFGAIESRSGGSDALSGLDVVFMGTFRAQDGRWRLATDLLSVSPTDPKDTPLAVFGDGTVAVKATAVSVLSETRSAGAGYPFMDISKEIDGRDVSVARGGPTVGMTYRF